MAVKKGNERIWITLTAKQVAFIRENAKRLDMTPSRFVKWLLDKNIGHLINRLPERDLETLIQIAKTKWVDFYEDDEEPDFGL